jgi:hypothetical protein
MTEKMTILPSGDQYVPVPPGVERPDNVGQPTEADRRTHAQKVKDAMDASKDGVSCPWCDLPFDGKVSLQRHILKDHASVVASDDEQEEAAGKATAQRAQGKKK